LLVPEPVFVPELELEPDGGAGGGSVLLVPELVPELELLPEQLPVEPEVEPPGEMTCEWLELFELELLWCPRRAAMCAPCVPLGTSRSSSRSRCSRRVGCRFTLRPSFLCPQLVNHFQRMMTSREKVRAYTLRPVAPASAGGGDFFQRGQDSGSACGGGSKPRRPSWKESRLQEDRCGGGPKPARRPTKIFPASVADADPEAEADGARGPEGRAHRAARNESCHGRLPRSSLATGPAVQESAK
jgi:hypothetical protein